MLKNWKRFVKVGGVEIKDNVDGCGEEFNIDF